MLSVPLAAPVGERALRDNPRARRRVFIYERVYCARGDIENRIMQSKDHGVRAGPPAPRADFEPPARRRRWTCKSRAKLAAALTEQGWRVSSTTVGRLLHRLDYRLQSARKRQEGATHPDCNAQLEHINQTADEHLAAGQPVVSVDTKKKELVGNFKNGGREWQPKGHAAGGAGP